MRQDIIHIPIPGGSGRMSSGAVQFQDDWPGLFIRGDECMGLALRLEMLKQKIGEATFAASGLQGLINVIERDVIIRPGGAK
jgi:hypothetical protein